MDNYDSHKNQFSNLDNYDSHKFNIDQWNFRLFCTHALFYHYAVYSTAALTTALPVVHLLYGLKDNEK